VDRVHLGTEGRGGQVAVATAAAVAAGAVVAAGAAAVGTAVEAMAAVMGGSDGWRWRGGRRGGASKRSLRSKLVRSMALA
jgi:hypothetical protein